MVLSGPSWEPEARGRQGVGSRVGSPWAVLEPLHRSLTYFQGPFLFKE